MYKKLFVNRDEEIANLINIIDERDDYRENSENGLSILLHGSWGTGKTKFISDFCMNDTVKNSYNVLVYNANSYDFYDNAYVPFFSFIRKQLKVRLAINTLAKVTSKNAIKTAINTSYMVVNTLFKFKTGETLDDLKQTFKDIKNDIDKENDFYKDFKEFENVKKNIKDKLKSKINFSNKPLVIIIDELDRCNPRFAIDTLEIVKHFMDIDGLVIVLSLDERQLQESVRTVFGQNMDADIYFSKFFDYKITLKTLKFSEIVDVESLDNEDNPNIMASIDHMYQELNISPREGHKIYTELLKKYNKFKHNGKTMSSDQVVFVFLILIMKQINNEIYLSIVNGDYDHYMKYISDKSDIDYSKLKKILNFTVNGQTPVGNILSTLNNCQNDIYENLEILGQTYNSEIKNFTTVKNNLSLLSRYIPQVHEGKTYLDNLKTIINS